MWTDCAEGRMGWLRQRGDWLEPAYPAGRYAAYGRCRSWGKPKEAASEIAEDATQDTVLKTEESKQEADFLPSGFPQFYSWFVKGCWGRAGDIMKRQSKGDNLSDTAEEILSNEEGP